MRPGLLCPGKAKAIIEAGIVRDASMRPGLLCPGKDGGHGGRPPPCPRFNEAGAVMPRKSALGEHRYDVRCVASMRPGLLCPGKAVYRFDCRAMGAALQ